MIAICTERADAEELRSEDDKAAGLPRAGRYLDGRLAPAGQGVTTHLHDVITKPDGKAFAYPVASERVVEKGSKVEALDATWSAVALEATKEKG